MEIIVLRNEIIKEALISISRLGFVMPLSVDITIHSSYESWTKSSYYELDTKM